MVWHAGGPQARLLKLGRKKLITKRLKQCKLNSTNVNDLHKRVFDLAVTRLNMSGQILVALARRSLRHELGLPGLLAQSPTRIRDKNEAPQNHFNSFG